MENAHRFGYGLMVVLVRRFKGEKGETNPNRVQFLTYTYTEVSTELSRFSWRFPTKTDTAGSSLHELASVIVRGRVVHERCTGFQFATITDHNNQPVSIEQPFLTLVRKGDAGGLHYQQGFLASLDEGTRLRETAKEAADSGNIIKTLGVPEWREALELWGLMRSNGQSSHRVYLIGALDRLVRFDANLASTYGRFLESPIDLSLEVGSGKTNLSFRQAITAIRDLGQVAPDPSQYNRLIQLF